MSIDKYGRDPGPSQAEQLEDLIAASKQAAEWAKEEREQRKCEECGAPNDYGLCYRCQCRLHALGVYDMDGDGWGA